MTNKTDERRKTAILAAMHDAKPTWIFSDFLAEIIVDAIRADDEANGMALLPRKPIREMIDALYGPYLSATAHESRQKAYQDMLAAWEKEHE